MAKDDVVVDLTITPMLNTTNTATAIADLLVNIRFVPYSNNYNGWF